MPQNKGKMFEKKLREDFNKIPHSFLYRLPDQATGWKGSNNPCDFIGYIYPNMFMLEVKSISGNTFPLTNFTQLQSLQQYANIDGVRRGIILWYTERFRIIYVPVKTVEKMIQDGKKSINIRTIDTESYEFLEVPSVKKRVYMDSDYSILTTLPEGW